MSQVLVHGIVAAAADVRLAEPGVRLLPHGELAAIVTDADRTGMRAASALRLHWRVLEELAQATTVLPVRFGTVMAGDQAVVDELLGARQDELLGALDELAGKVQLTVKGDFDQERLMRGVVESSPAVARLRDRIRGVPEAAAYYDRIRLGQLIAEDVERARERCAARVLERLDPLAVAVSRERVSAIEAAVNAAFLVEKEREQELREAVAELEREFAGTVLLRCIGPLPPYSFSDVGSAPRSPTWA